MREEELATEQTREENPTERSSWLVWLNYLFCSLHSAIIPHLVCVLSELVDSAVVLYYPHWRKIEDGGEGYIFLLQYLFPGIHPSLTQSWTPIAHRPTGSKYFAWEKTRIHAQMTHPWAGGNRRSHRTDETGNIAAILSNRPTVRQISTSAGLILIALCTACASWIEYCQELETGMDRAEQVDIVGFD